MTRYSWLNLGVAVCAAIAAGTCIRSRREVFAVFRTAVAVCLIFFPWDYFLLHWRAWAHNDPGPHFLGVPLNDPILVFLCTVLTASVLLYLDRSGGGGHADAERERCGDENA